MAPDASRPLTPVEQMLENDYARENLRRAPRTCATPTSAPQKRRVKPTGIDELRRQLQAADRRARRGRHGGLRERAPEAEATLGQAPGARRPPRAAAAGAAACFLKNGGGAARRGSGASMKFIFTPISIILGPDRRNDRPEDLREDLGPDRRR